MYKGRLGEFSMYLLAVVNITGLYWERRKKLPEPPHHHFDMGFGEGFSQLAFRCPIPLADGALFWGKKKGRQQLARRVDRRWPCFSCVMNSSLPKKFERRNCQE